MIVDVQDPVSLNSSTSLCSLRAGRPPPVGSLSHAGLKRQQRFFVSAQFGGEPFGFSEGKATETGTRRSAFWSIGKAEADPLHPRKGAGRSSWELRMEEIPSK